MDSREHGRSSSSPSVRVEQLVRRRSRRPGEEIKVTLSDASSFFVSMRVWEEAPFHEGDELPVERWNEILSRTTSIRARGQALSLLARSEHSRFLLAQKLLQRGFDMPTITRVLNELQDGGELSDERYAVSWVRGRLRSHPEGRSRLVGGLRNRGVDAALAESAVDEVLADEGLTMTDAARAYAERLTRRKALPAAKLADRLYRRGFAGSVVRSVVDVYADDADDTDDPGDSDADRE
jgi:regulatory protein